ncbi:MAG: CLC_0170 family protein [Halanaerobiales bacterium]|jgi:hypothetical protein
MEDIFSIYFVLLLLFCGFISLIFDTDHAYFFGQYKDYLISFFTGLLYIFLALAMVIFRLIATYIL